MISIATPSCAEETESELLKDLVQIADVMPPTISPDGEFVAFSVVRPSVETNAHEVSWFLMPTDGSSPARTIWSDGELRVQDGFATYGRPTWSPDGRRLAFPVTMNDEVSLIIHDRSADRTEKTGAAFGTVGEFAFIDKDRLVVTVGPRPPRLQQFVDHSGSGGVLVPHGEVRNLSLGLAGFHEPASASGSFAPQAALLTVGQGGSTALANGEASALLARHAQVGAFSGLMSPALYDPSTPLWTAGVIERFPDLADAVAFSVVNDGRAAAYLARDGASTRLVISDEGDSRSLGDVGPYGSAHLIWSRRGDVVNLVTNSPSGWRLQRYSRIGSVLTDSTGRGEIVIAAGTDARGRLIAVLSDIDTPGDLVAIDEAGAVQRLTALNPHLAKYAPRPPRQIEARDRYGRPVRGRAYLPADCRLCPVVVHIYGSNGFPRGGTGDEWPFLAFLRRGIAVIDADPPLDETDYSNDGTADGQRKYVDGPVSGAIALIDALAKERLVDPKRAGIVGLSFGAMVASWGALKTDRFAASSSAGIDLYYATQNYVNGSFDRFFVDAIKRKDGRAIMEYLGMNVAPTVRTAMLSHEPEEEYRMSIPFIGMLRAFGRPVEQYVYANEGHAKTQPRNRLEIYRRNAQWFDFWLIGREDRDPAYAGQYARWRQLKIERDQ